MTLALSAGHVLDSVGGDGNSEVTRWSRREGNRPHRGTNRRVR